MPERNPPPLPIYAVRRISSLRCFFSRNNGHKRGLRHHHFIFAHFCIARSRRSFSARVRHPRTGKLCTSGGHPGPWVSTFGRFQDRLRPPPGSGVLLLLMVREADPPARNIPLFPRVEMCTSPVQLRRAVFSIPQANRPSWRYVGEGSV